MSLNYSSFSLSDPVQYPFLQIFLLLLDFSYFCPCSLVTKCYIQRISNTISQLIMQFLLKTNPFDNGHPSFPFVLLFVWRKLCGQRRVNWWRWLTRLKFIGCKDLCWALRGWPWIKIIILVEHFGIICGSLLWSGLTMVHYWKMRLAIVEMKHRLVLVLSL